MAVVIFVINTDEGKRYGLKDAKTEQVLNGGKVWKKRTCALLYARKNGYELI